MDISKEFGTDERLEEEGAWVDIGDGTLLCVARIGNKKYAKYFERLMKPHRAQFRTGNIPIELQEVNVTKTLAKTVLLGWENLTYQGKLLEYSVDNAIMVMSDLKDFRTMVTEIAGEMGTFKEEEVEETEKNSERSSGGDLTGENTTPS